MFFKLCRVAVLAGLLVACTKTGAPTTSNSSANAVDAGIGASAQAAEVVPTALTPIMQRLTTQGGFASLPDRGALVDYAPQGTRRDGAYTWHRAQVSEEHALRAVVDGHLRLPTPSGKLLDIVYDRMIEHDSGDWTWIGHLKDDPGAQTILTFGAKAVFGAVDQTAQRPLRLTTQSGTAWVVETDASQLRGLASAGANPTSPDYLHVPRGLLPQAEQSSISAQGSAPMAVTATAATTTVDLLIGYTSGFASQIGSASAVNTRLNYLVDVTNTAYANSQVNARVRLVHAMQVSYTDTNDNGDALEQLTGYDSDAKRYTTPNAAFNALRAAREIYGADLVSLIRPFRDPEQNGCGIAWLIGGGKTGITPGDGQDYFGYSVVSDGQDVNESDHKTYYCRDESLAHEMGHNMGAAHDRATAAGDDGKLDDPADYGAFTYSFGYKTGASAGNFYDIMAYGDTGQTPYRVFSNPRITSCGGYACGTTTYEDVSRDLSTLIPVVATFRSSVLTKPVDDFNGDGISDLVWRNYQSGSDTIWFGADSSSRLSFATVTSTAWRIVAIGDFNGDGISDLFWRNSKTGANSIWSSANITASITLPSVALSWVVAGVGDFDGDGKNDVLWRNTTSGANSIWRSGNPATPLAIAALIGKSWVAAAVGDFNGDKRSDIVWRDRSSGSNILWWSGKFSTRSRLTAVPGTSWFVAGVGDLDANGKDDLVWRNGVSGGNSVWPGADARQAIDFTPITDLHWQLERVADYNGDSKYDLLWRNPSTGAGVIWYSANFNSRKSIASVPGPFWQIAP